MPSVPAVCQKCGLAFPSDFIIEPHIKQIGIGPGFRQKCPLCGGLAPILDGLYDGGEEFVVAQEGSPPFTMAVLAKIREIAEAAKAKSSTSDEILAQLEVDAPILAAALRPVAKYRTASVLLIIIFLILNSCRFNADFDVNRFVDQLATVSDEEIQATAATQQEIEPSDADNQAPAATQQQVRPSEKPKLSRQQRRFLERQGPATSERVDRINPSDAQFTRQRISLADLAVNKRILDKTFIDCELFGPANLFLIDNVTLNTGAFVRCDIVVAKPGAKMFSVIGLQRVTILRCQIYDCLMMIQPELVPMFREMGANFVNALPGEQAAAPPHAHK